MSTAQGLRSYYCGLYSDRLVQVHYRQNTMGVLCIHSNPLWHISSGSFQGYRSGAGEDVQGELWANVVKPIWYFSAPFVSYVSWAKGLEAYLNLYVVLHQVPQELFMPDLGDGVDPFTMMGRAQVFSVWWTTGLCMACCLNEVDYGMSFSWGVPHCRLW